MSDVVFIHSPMILYTDFKDKEKFKEHGGDEKSYYPLGILYIAAMLEKSGHSVKIIDVGAEDKTLKDVIEIIDIEKPLIIGISAMTTSIASAVALAKNIRSRYGDSILIGLGGVHICCDSTFIERFPIFDFGIVGEGEETFVEIVEQVKKGIKVKGVIAGKAVQNLDLLPFPARHHISSQIYLREEQSLKDVPAAGILSSRGCPFSCSFCCIPAIGQKVRMRSAKNIVDEMEEIYDQCQGGYSFVDDCFTLSKKHVLAFCQEVIDRKMKIKFIASTRASALDYEVASALKRAGCTDLYFGVESGNARIRNEIIKKRVSNEEINRAVSLCRKHKILSNLFLMVGFPTETKKEMMDTVNIGSRVKADIVGIHTTIPLPGSEIFNYAIENGMLPKDIIDKYASGEMGRGFRGVWPLFVPKGHTIKELFNIKKMTYMRFYLSPMWWFRRLKVWFLIPGKFKDDLKLFKIAFHVFKTGGTKGQLS